MKRMFILLRKYFTFLWQNKKLHGVQPNTMTCQAREYLTVIKKYKKIPIHAIAMG